MVKKIPHVLYTPETYLLCSQEPATEFWLGPDEISPHPYPS